MDSRGLPGVTSVEYWDTVGEEWEGEIHDSLAEDCGGVVQGAIAAFCPPGATAIDFGCGVGKYLPLLAQHAATPLVNVNPSIFVKILAKRRSF